MERILYHAKCDCCGSGMNKGYCIYGGEQYYCSDECLHETIPPDEWLELYTDGGDSYWTEWYIEGGDDANYEEINGKLIEIEE